MSLRDALEKALDDELCTCDKCEDGDKYNDGVRSVQKAVREVLAAHPVEPAGVSDEAVEPVAHAINEHRGTQHRCACGWRYDSADQHAMHRARAALEAALPYLQARVSCGHDEYYTDAQAKARCGQCDALINGG